MSGLSCLVAEFQVASGDHVPGQTALGQFIKERIGIELFYIAHAGHDPFACQEHHCAYHGRYAGGVAHCLCSSLAVCVLVRTVVVDVVC